MGIDSLFTPEVMEKMFSALEKAAEGSTIVLSIYFLIPILSSLINLALWVTIITLIGNRVVTLFKGCKLVSSCEDLYVRLGYNNKDSFNEQLTRLSDGGVIYTKQTAILKRALDDYEEKYGRLR